MPRRKRNFIQRSKAQNFQLVHRPTSTDPNRHVLVSGDGTVADPSPTTDDSVTIDPTEWDVAHKTQEYELGEFGFADDGYDYAKHFRTIGGGGGVFIDAESGMPDPEAITTRVPSKPVEEKRADIVVLREEAEEPEEEPESDWRNPEDVKMQQDAIDQIKSDRKHNVDLQAVFAALDTEGDLSSTSASDIEETDLPDQADFLNEAVSQSGDEQTLEDDFVTIAAEDQTGHESEHETDSNLLNDASGMDAIVNGYREPRLLDAQFDEFMRGYASDDSSNDEDVEDLKRFAQVEAEKEPVDETILALLTENEKQEFGMGEDEAEVLNGISELNCWNHSEGLDEEPREAGTSMPADGDEQQTSARRQKFETYANAEFERGMTGVLDSFARIPGTDALEAIDGLQGARQAIVRQETEDKQVLERKNEIDEESDGHDSDLDTLFDDMYKQKGDQWDCQTIISTYTNVDNHPSVIDAPESSKRRAVQNRPVICLDPRTQAPAEFMPAAAAGASSRQDVDFGTRRIVRVQRTLRDKDESKEDKKARKVAVKEAARERRALKSEMKKAFRAEDQKQSTHAARLGNAKVSVQF